MGCSPRVSHRLRPGLVHLLGCLGTLAVALVLLNTVFPYYIDLVFPRTGRPIGLRGEAIDYLLIALVPVVVWLVPPLVRAVARVTHRAHKAFLGRNGFYVRFPTPRRVRFRDTVIHALGPFAIDLVVIAEIEYYLSGANESVFARALFSIPLLFLAGVVTSLMPGGWLVDALDLRLVNPSNGEVVREAALFEGILGPIGALALLVSFVTLAHSVGDSYEAGVVLLALWAARMFPPVLVAVSVYRVMVEPDVLPSLRTWADREGIPVTPAVEPALRSLAPRPTEGESDAGAEPSKPAGHEGREQLDEQERARDN